MYLGNMLKTTVLGHKYNKKKQKLSFFQVLFYYPQQKRCIFNTFDLKLFQIYSEKTKISSLFHCFLIIK